MNDRTPILILAIALLPGTARSDEVLLKGGGRLSGRIVSRTADKVEVDVGAGRITVPASSVVRIEEGVSPLQEYEERAGRLAPGDVEAWIALAGWAEDQGLGTQAREAYQRVLAVSPDDPRANDALGNVRVDGRWVSEDEAWRAWGYVRFEGEWITPAEHEAILRERDAEDQRADAEARVREAEERAAEAEARAAEAEARAHEAEAEAELEGLPLWYGWGAGPVYWPAGPIVSPPRAPSRPARLRPVPR